MELTGERFMPEMKGIIELEHLNRYYFVVNQLDLKDKIVVDLASGEGYGSNILTKYAKKVIGIDISNEAIEYATKKYIQTNLQFVIGSAVKIPLADNSVDVFVSFETIEHHDMHDEMLSEIKRVLKPEGIIVISSPDKHFYSDVPQYQNEFHVKELYYTEFKQLIEIYFSNCFYFSQRIFSGSIITIDDETTLNKIPVVTNLEGVTSKLTPMYNIVVASNTEDVLVKLPHHLYGETEHILTTVDIEKAKASERLSLEYKLGKKIFKKFKFLKTFLENRNK